jgi:hypothetical protein
VSENLIESVAPHLAPPVTRESILSASEAEAGADLALAVAFLAVPPCFAADEAE